MQQIELKHDELDYRSREAFKTLRTNIEFSGEDVKVICITSCTPNEGKSNISFEVSKAFAQSGRRVLLLDADLRKSVMRRRHRRGKVRLGLANYLAGWAHFQDTICETDVENLWMVFSGPVPPNPSELLNSKRFKAMIAEARNFYDIVIIDTPPLGSVIDTAVVSKCCDGAVVVIESGAISYRFVRKVKDQLDVAGCKILGCVLNKVPLGGKGYYGKYYGKYYGRYYGRYYGKYYGKYYGNYGEE